MDEKPKYYNQARNVAAQKYLAANMEQIRFWVRKGEKERVKLRAKARGMSARAYLIHAVNTLEGEQVLTPPEKGEDTEE